ARGQRALILAERVAARRKTEEEPRPGGHVLAAEGMEDSAQHVEAAPRAIARRRPALDESVVQPLARVPDVLPVRAEERAIGEPLSGVGIEQQLVGHVLEAAAVSARRLRPAAEAREAAAEEKPAGD